MSDENGVFAKIAEDRVRAINTEWGEIAYSTQEQVKTRKALDKHNSLIKVLIIAIIVFLVVQLLILVLALKTQLIGTFLYWLANLRVR